MELEQQRQGSQAARFKSLFHSLLAVLPWAYCLKFYKPLVFILCKIEMIKIPWPTVVL